MSKKLYKIDLIGSTKYTAYAIGETIDEAITKFQDALIKQDIGFIADRKLKSVSLIAEDAEFPLCGICLYE